LAFRMSGGGMIQPPRSWQLKSDNSFPRLTF
jgi:hypothetical protein